MPAKRIRLELPFDKVAIVALCTGDGCGPDDLFRSYKFLGLGRAPKLTRALINDGFLVYRDRLIKATEKGIKLLAHIDAIARAAIQLRELQSLARLKDGAGINLLTVLEYTDALQSGPRS